MESNATTPSGNGIITPAPVTEETLLVLGPVFIGLLLSYMLFGISVMQLYLYYLSFPRDSKFIKALVYTIFLLDILQSITIAALGWDIFCASWGAPTLLLPVNWTNGVLPAVSGITAALVQSFYAWRIWKMSKWRVVPLAIVSVALAQMCATLAIAAKIPSTPDILALHNIYVQAIVWLAGAGCADIMIALSMLYLLYKVGRSNFRGTQRIINHLIRLTIETGFATATCALAELICFLVYQENNLHLLFALMLCKMYSNSLMTSLNSRTTWNSERHTQSSRSRISGSSSSQWTNSMNLSVAPLSSKISGTTNTHTHTHTNTTTTTSSSRTGGRGGGVLGSVGSGGGLFSRSRSRTGGGGGGFGGIVGIAGKASKGGRGRGRGTPSPTVVHISTATTRDGEGEEEEGGMGMGDVKRELTLEDGVGVGVGVGVGGGVQVGVGGGKGGGKGGGGYDGGYEFESREREDDNDNSEEEGMEMEMMDFARRGDVDVDAGFGVGRGVGLGVGVGVVTPPIPAYARDRDRDRDVGGYR